MKRLALFFLASVSLLHADDATSPYAKWQHGPPTDPHFFPLAVWLQQPRNAQAYHDAGINTYLALDGQPNDENLATLKAAGMKAICEQSEVGLKHVNDPTIIGWMHGDEPDNAQSLPGGKGYGPPIDPKKIADDYTRIAQADPSRPVMLNLGQGVAYEDYVGRGVRTGHIEDYPEYLKGADVASFDIYPVVDDSPAVSGKLWLVAKGVDNLIKAGKGEKPVWNCLECTHIGSPNKATPHQVRAEAWMALIHGSQGLIYFVHQFKPSEDDAALLHDPEMLAGVTELNKQITSLAPALNSPTIKDGVQVQADPKAPIDVMVKHDKKTIYVFAAGVRDATGKAKFTVPDATFATSATVIGEKRSVPIQGGSFSDDFGPWDVHLYQIDN